MKCFLFLLLATESMQRCSYPQAEDGEKIIEECFQRSCESSVWKLTPVANMCCYEKKSYSINTTISSSMSEDGCAKAAIDCVEGTPGNAKMVLRAQNYCQVRASNEQLQESNKTKYDDKVADAQVLLIGPGYSSSGKSEVLSLPDLAPLNCSLPVYPGGRYHSYVGRASSEGVLMCGGMTTDGLTSSCYLLTARGYKDIPGLLNKRYSAASIVTPQGWWVTGGHDGDQGLTSTELWSNNQWQEHLRLPEPMWGHCMTWVNNSHILITGGQTGNWDVSGSSYLYSEGAGFTKVENMKTPRADHGCLVINENLVFVAGGFSNNRSLKETEYLNLTSLTWSAGPDLPDVAGSGSAEMIGSLTVGEDAIFKLEDLGMASKKQWQWVEVRKRQYLGTNFGAYIISEKLCK